MPAEHFLDNPIWHALTGRQAALAEVGEGARRFPPEVTTLGGLLAPSPAAYRNLAALLLPGESVALFLEAPAAPPPECVLLESDLLIQMVWDRSVAPGPPAPPALRLLPSDLPEMLALAAATRPGPFGRRTPELGRYLGIRAEGRLAAMAGERMQLTALTEISAVCTDPADRGKGYASALVSELVREQLARGETPFLHLRASNRGALRVYRQLGFAARREFHLAVVKAA